MGQAPGCPHRRPAADRRMSFRTLFAAAALVLGPALVIYAAEPKKPSAKGLPIVGKAVFARDIAPLTAKYCSACHGEKTQIQGINFRGFKDENAVVKSRDIWEKVSQSLSSGHMPPKNMPQPTAAEKALLVGWIDAKLSQVDCDIKDPGRVTMRRLNRAEYNNTIRDLLAVDFKPADDFPSDDVGYGFDNIGDVLSISPLLMEKYLAAAEKIVEQAIVAPEDRAGPASRFEAERVPETGGDGTVTVNGRTLFGNGAVWVQFDFPRDGEYLLRARAHEQRAGDEAAKMVFRLDEADQETFDVSATSREPKVYEQRVHVKRGPHRFSAAFINDLNDRRRRQDRNLEIDYLEIVGPARTETDPLPESHQRIFTVPYTPEAQGEAARKILADFARRAYRRPVADAEVDRLLRVVELGRKNGESFERSIGLAVQAVLVSPNFLFRVELDPRTGDAAAAHPVNDFELASRLSYFLWSSMPDDELFAAAASGALRSEKALEDQVWRMLKSPKAKALVENFAAQWLTLRNLQNVNPDPKRFPGFDAELRDAMRKETELFFETVMREDRSVLEFLDANWTVLNERLAKHYGIDWVKGDNFRKVVLTGSPRRGVLSHASILTLTSNPTRTSPVKRGKWVLEQVLGTPPPPPPPDVPELEEQSEKLTGTLRERMEQHRKDPTCASCHQQMDTIGFGLENFDAVGAWRTQDGGAPIDSSGTLPNGKSFNGPSELAQVLKLQKEQFVRNLAQTMLTFAIGRGIERYDRCNVDEMAKNVGRNGHRFSALVMEVVKSEPFRMRRGEGVAQ
jgi:hypothetical protein